MIKSKNEKVPVWIKLSFYLLTKIFIDKMSVFFIDEDGFLWGMGRNDFGQLGLGDQIERYCFEKICDVRFKIVSRSYTRTFAIDEMGYLWACGKNNNGLLGFGNSQNVLSIEKNNSLDIRFTFVKTGGNHTIALDENGFLWGVGNNNFGQLGLDEINSVDTFMKISEEIFIAVSCGSNHTIAIDKNGFLWGCGCNNYGQLGFDSNRNKNLLQKISTLRYTSVFCSDEKTFVIDTNGNLFVCGYSDSLHLWFLNKNVTKLTQISKLKFSNISYGYYHAVGIDADGHAWGAGSNNLKQLGFSDSEIRISFEQISNRRFQNVTTTNFKTFLVDIEGSLWIFGNNNKSPLDFIPIKINHHTKIKYLSDQHLTMHRHLTTKAAVKF